MQRWFARQGKTSPTVTTLFGLAWIAQTVDIITNYPGASRYGGWYVQAAFVVAGAWILAVGIAGLRERRSASVDQ